MVALLLNEGFGREDCLCFRLTLTGGPLPQKFTFLVAPSTALCVLDRPSKRLSRRDAARILI